MIASTCRAFTYKNFDGEDISDAPANPSFWEMWQQPNSYRLKADLIYCDKKESLGVAGKVEETCSREIKSIVLQNFKPPQRTLPDLNFIPSDDPEKEFLSPEEQNFLDETYTRPTKETFRREKAIETPCFAWTLDGDKYVKELADAQLGEIHEQQRIETLYHVGFAALAAFSASALAFGAYKLYRRCTRPAPAKNAGPTIEELEKLPIQFRPKIAPAGRG